MSKERIRAYSFLLFPYLIYIVATAIVFALSLYTLHSDAISMINIAEKWHAGHIMDAVNSLWPPLISVFIAVAMFLPVHEVIAFKLVQIVLGFGALILSDLIIKNWIKNPWVRVSVLTAAGLLLMAYELRDGTADLIACVAVLLFTLFITREGFFEKKWDGAIMGVVWAVAYFARTYLLYFIAVELAFVFIYKWLLSKERHERKMFLRNALATFGVFVVLSSPWIFGLHAKFHMWTTGISGTLNYYKYSSAAIGAPVESMFLGDHLIPPTAPTDQSMMTEMLPNMPAKWSPFQSRAAFEYQVLKIWKNLKILFAGIDSVSATGIFAVFSPLLAGTLFLFALFVFSRPAWYRETKNIILLSIAFIYPLGYLIIEVNDRYFYIVALFGLFFGGYLLEQLMPAHKKKLLVAAAILLALTYVPFTPTKDLIAGYSFYYNRYQDGLYIKAHLPTENKRLATLGEDDSKSFRIAYYAGIPYYWRLDPTVPIETVVSELCKYKIDYPFINNASGNPLVAARYAYLKKYYSGELRLQKYPELSVLYNAHLPCWTAPQVTAK